MLWREAVELLTLKLSDLLALRYRFRHFLAMQLGQLRFVIEGVDVCHATGHVEPYNPLGSRFKMRGLENPVPVGHRRALRCMTLSSQQRGQGHRT